MIRFESGSPIFADVDGHLHFICDVSHPQWGPGHARGTVVADGGIRNVLTFPPSLPYEPARASAQAIDSDTDVASHPVEGSNDGRRRPLPCDSAPLRRYTARTKRASPFTRLRSSRAASGWRLFAAVNSPRLRFPVVVSLSGAHLLVGGWFASGVSDSA
jgi:hypothetical protein